MAATIYDTHCCGIKEIDNLGTCDNPELAMSDVCRVMPKRSGTQTLAPRYSLLTFSGVVTRRASDHSSNRPDNYGQAFADYITANNLGEVTAGPVTTNRRSGNDICMWIWRFDLDRLQQWWNAHAPAPAAGTYAGIERNYGAPIWRAEVPSQPDTGAFTRAMAEQFARDEQEYRRRGEERYMAALRREAQYSRYITEDDSPF